MDPKVSMWLNIAGLVLSALTGAAALFSDLFGDGPAKKIVAGISLGALVITTINTALHGYSTSAPGPMSKG